MSVRSWFKCLVAVASIPIMVFLSQSCKVVQDTQQWLSKVMRMQTAKDYVHWVITEMRDDLSSEIRFVHPSNSIAFNINSLGSDYYPTSMWFFEVGQYDSQEDLFAAIEQKFERNFYKLYKDFVEECVLSINEKWDIKAIKLDGVAVSVELMNYRKEKTLEITVYYQKKTKTNATSQVNTQLSNILRWENLLDFNDVSEYAMDAHLIDFYNKLTSDLQQEFWVQLYDNMYQGIQNKNNNITWDTKNAFQSMYQKDSFRTFDSLLKASPAVSSLSQNPQRKKYQYVSLLVFYVNEPYRIARNKELYQVGSYKFDLVEDLAENYKTFDTYSALQLTSDFDEKQLKLVFADFCSYYSYTDDMDSAWHIFATQMDEMIQWQQNQLSDYLLDHYLQSMYQHMNNLASYSVNKNVVANAISVQFDKNISIDFDNWVLYADDVIQPTQVIFRAYQTIWGQDVLIEGWEIVIPILPTEELDLGSVPLVVRKDWYYTADLPDVAKRYKDLPLNTKIKVYWIWDAWETITRIKIKQ